MVVIMMLFGLVDLSAQKKAGERPKIGVVLSGGGAKGMAHIGILKALEQANIYPDYITGTSMGSIIAALYSLGYSPAELEIIASEIDWNVMLSNKIPLNLVAPDEKQHYDNHSLRIVYKQGKFNLPEGVLSGQSLQILLANLTRPAHQYKSFLDFPIPFACIGTNMETGRAKVFTDGDIVKALRASMAIPTVFTPVYIQDSMYVDGGVVHNFPVEDVIAMGADIVIGSNTGSQFHTKEKLTGITEILAQTVFFKGIEDAVYQTTLCDIAVRPDLGDLGAADFNKAREIIDAGIAAGQSFLPQFQALADSLGISAFTRKSIVDKSFDTLDIDAIVPLNNKVIGSNNILRIIDYKGGPISLQDLEKKIRELYGYQYFESITYNVLNNDSGTELLLNIDEADPAIVSLGVHYDNEDDIGLNATAILRNTILPYSKLTVDAFISPNWYFDVEYRKRMLKKFDWQVYGALQFNNTSDIPFPRFNASATLFNVIDYQSKFGIQKSIQSAAWFNAEWGQTSRKLSPKFNVTDEVKRIKYSYNYFDFSFTYDNRNTSHFRLKGTQIRANFRNRLGTDVRLKFDDDADPLFISALQESAKAIIQNFYTIDINGDFIFPVSNRFVVEDILTVHYQESENMGLLDEQSIGGLNPTMAGGVPFYGLTRNEHIGTDFIVNRVNLRYNPKRNLYLYAGADLLLLNYPKGLFQENITKSYFEINGEPKEAILGYGLGLGYNSIFGPIKVNTSLRKGGKVQFFLSVGYTVDRKRY